MGRLVSLTIFKRPRVWVPAIIIVLVIGTVIATIHNMKAPAQGSINQAPPAKAEPTDPYAQGGTYRGKYIEFKYPAHYKKIASKISGNSQESVIYHTTYTTGQQIAIAVAAGDINGDSGVVFRRQHKELYTETDSQKWTEFTKKDGTEDTFYLQHSGRLATVSATAPFNNQSGDGFYVASSLKWLA